MLIRKDWFTKTDKSNKSNKSYRGQSVLEVLIAIGVFAISMTAAFQLFFGGQSLSVDSANAGLAADYAREGVEAARGIRARNWAELTDGDHGLIFQNDEWMFGSSSVSDARGIFTRTVSVYTINGNLKVATTTVSWQTDPLRPQKIEFVEQLTNWENLTQSSCKIGALSGNWAAPQSVGSGDLGSGNSGTDILAKPPYVFVSGTASTAAKPDIFVFDASNPNAPVLVQSLNIGSGGINSIYIKGNYLYAASPNDGKELIIFDISNPAAISEAGSLDLPGSSNALSVIAFGNTAVIGRADSAANELNFIDVSNPAAPAVVAQFGGLDDVRDFAIDDQYLYVLEDSGIDVRIYDITNPNNPAYVDGYDRGSIDYLSAYIYHREGARHLLVGGDENIFEIIGATTTNQMFVRATLNVGGKVNDIVCSAGNLAFLATDNSTKEFIIVNIADPDSPVEYASLNYPQVATGIDFADNKIFMSVRSNDALRIIIPSP